MPHSMTVALAIVDHLVRLVVMEVSATVGCSHLRNIIMPCFALLWAPRIPSVQRYLLAIHASKYPVPGVLIVDAKWFFHFFLGGMCSSPSLPRFLDLVTPAQVSSHDATSPRE